MALHERLSLYISAEAKERLVEEVKRRRDQGLDYAKANQTSIIEELILKYLPKPLDRQTDI